ncbi:MAG: hemolysin family protein [Bacteroidia bacterium]|nr:hemolysin family protein [Bacteroidia bacterium]
MLLLITILVFLLLSAFFSGSEIAFVSANKLGIAIKKEQHTKKGKIISDFYKNKEDFLSTMLVGNNIALVAFTYFTTILLTPVVEPISGDGLLGLLIYTLIITIIVLLFGEFLPKTIFGMIATRALFFCARPLYFFKKILAIPTFFMTGLSSLILKKILRVPTDNVEAAFTRLDLEHYIHDSLSDDQDDIDKDILTNALTLGHNNVAHCMVPRTEIVSVDINASLDDALEAFKTSKVSRVIVLDGEIDNVEGYIHHQQLLDDPTSIKSILLDIIYVPEVMNLKDLMLQFIKQGTSIACVVDEFGGTAGIITLEDILEEIFGEIEDEHDVEDYIMQQINENEYRFSGRLEIDFINEKFPEMGFPEGDYQTLSGYVVMTSETIPDLNEEVTLGQYTFKVEKVDDTKIDVLHVRRNLEEEEEEV